MAAEPGVPRVRSVNVGRAAPLPGLDRRTGIDKRPVTGPVAAGPLGLAGDEQADRAHHGGVDQAVYAYAGEDLERWAGLLGRPLRAGQFGENLTTEGLPVTAAVVGERWAVGTVVLEVSCPRIPCRVFAAWLGEPDWVRRFTAEGRCGAYLRVCQPGRLQAGDPVTVVHRPGHGLTVGETFRALTGDRALVPRLLDAPELPAEAHAFARRVLAEPPVAPDPGA